MVLLVCYGILASLLGDGYIRLLLREGRQEGFLMSNPRKRRLSSKAEALKVHLKEKQSAYELDVVLTVGEVNPFPRRYMR